MSKNVEDVYKMVSQVEHILLRPDTYIGSVEISDQELWICEDSDQISFKFEEFSYCQGLYKIFDEILVNAADNYQRDKSTDRISVSIDNDTIMVENTGTGIPIQIHKQYNIYVPEMIFGRLLTSSNYDDSEQKVTGGRNGFGAKLANLFSSYFKVETIHQSQKFTMIWTDNMKKHSQPEITKTNEKPYTRITFKPDLKNFQTDRLSDIVPLLQKRVIDLAGILPISIYLNGKKVPINNFKDYAQLYGINGKFAYASQNKPHKWEILVSSSDGQFSQVSFVNSINTIRGGTHVNYIVDQIAEGLLNHIKKKYKEMKNIKPFQVKSFIKIFLNCQIVNPAFDSQTKETLTTKAQKFGSTFEISEKFIDEIIKKTEIIDNVILQAKSRLNKQLSKQLSAKKQQRLLGIDKLEDANDAGTKNADLCTLILTEGDSAKSLAMAGIEIVGRDRFGVFPLRGKLLNVRDASIQMIMKNSEIEQLVKIMGLQFNKNYENTKSLRYGSIMIMTDQDHDGHHIKGLIINFIEKFWPSLFKMKGFLKQFVTPIIKVTKGKESHSFFSIGEYKKFIAENPTEDYKVKYYKGLGTSTDAEAQQYFSNLTLHRKVFTYSDQTDSDYIDLVFSKSKADQRKDWLSEYSWKQVEDTLDYSKPTVRYRNFVTDCLAMHSINDNLRSIPSSIDGLKPTQRKIIHTLLNHSKQEYKVSSLSGLVTTYAQYHHGEQSLQQTVVAMAQNFTGSNNINLLLPIGQFGTRSMGGKDAAQARYIGTKLSPLTTKIFNEDDLHTLNYLDEEGYTVEPFWFTPILPLVLINGAEGIGTGWSTQVPNFNPREICQQIKRKLRGEEFEELVPWYKGFTGSITAGTNQYIAKGSFIQHKNHIYITEIPPKKTVKEYQAFIQSKMEIAEGKSEPEILDMKEYHAGNKVCFELKVNDEVLKQDLEKYFKLQTTIAMTNLVLFNEKGLLKRYSNVSEILEEFYQTRIKYYQLRKEYLLSKYQNELELVQSKSKFIEGMIDNSIQLRGLKKNEMCKKLQSLGFKGISKMEKIKSTRNLKEIDTDNLEKQYDYLLSMPMWNFSEEKIIAFKQQIKQLQDQINQLNKKTLQQLWSEDIDDFLDELTKVEEQETQEMIKRVEKNAEKLLKGGANYLKTYLLKGKDDFAQQEDYDSESDDDGPSRDPRVLKKVIKEFANFGIKSLRDIPQQKFKIQIDKQTKKKDTKENQDDNKSEKPISMDLEDDSPKRNKKVIDSQSEDEIINQKKNTRRNQKQNDVEEIQISTNKDSQINKFDNKINKVESKIEKAESKIKKSSKLKKIVPQYDSENKASEIKRKAEQEKAEEDQKLIEQEKEELEKQRVPVDSLKVPIQDKVEMDLFQKYGFGDFMKYLTPINGKDNNPIPSLADRILQRTKQGEINFDKIVADKKQESAQKEKKDSDHEIDDFLQLDLSEEQDNKQKEKVTKTTQKTTVERRSAKKNTEQQSQQITTTPSKRKQRKQIIESSDEEEPLNKKQKRK
ncbi:unnamed protein product [Paramecium primaurelia]|uniref:DNA topoisomerase 2 n=1 Tax=Paramecium primaurelia TaxID=5886 RepID=A0A8S1P833_PARPR|nr:unnamed protein product [Paramecium primaurelia]